MKVIIAGSRGINDIEFVYEAIDRSEFDITEVVSGRCSGVDTIGEWWARKHGIPLHFFPADWKKYGLAAGTRRNKQMAEYGDALVVVWDGVSSGTKNMIENMHLLNKPVFKVLWPGLEDF